MIFDTKKIVRNFGLGLLAILLMLSPILCKSKGYSQYDKSYQLTSSNTCEQLAKDFRMFLDIRAATIIKNSSEQNPRVIKIISTVRILKCISKTKVVVSVITLGMFAITKDNKTIKACSQDSTTLLLQRKGAFISSTKINSEGFEDSMVEVPCK